MTNQEFDALVRRLEDEARRNPAGYKFKVVMLALLGNAYMSAMLLLLMALLAAMVVSIAVLKALAVKLIIVLSIFLGLVLKALWVKIAPPEGYGISAGQAPELFTMIAELRLRLGAPRFHDVLITDDFNAGVIQAPRLGIFGWSRNYLLIGLPLMKSLKVEQFKAVLAHEFGHLAKGHGRMSNWIYRQRLRWSRLLTVLESNESRGVFLFKPFLNWFAPYFNAFSFPLARANEYEADATSAHLTSPRAAAEALTAVNVISSYFAERYWPQIHRQADDHPQPGTAPYFSMSLCVATEIDEDSGKGWLEQAMARETTCADTHPALNDRLMAIGEGPKLALPASGQGADRLLGHTLDDITRGFDRRWHDNILPNWQERHREVQDGRRKLAELNAKHTSGSELTPQEAYDRASLTESVGQDVDAALDQFRALYERAPDDTFIGFALGARLLNRNDAAGCILLEHAMLRSEDTSLQSCELLRNYHWRNGHEAEAHAWHERLVEQEQLHRAAEKERSRILLKDIFEPQYLSEDELSALRTQLQAIPDLRRAYLVKKRVKYFSHRPCYVFAYRVTGPLQLHRKQRVMKVLQQLQTRVQFPNGTLIINIDAENYRFGRKFNRMYEARIL